LTFIFQTSTKLIEKYKISMYTVSQILTNLKLLYSFLKKSNLTGNDKVDCRRFQIMIFKMYEVIMDLTEPGYCFKAQFMQVIKLKL